MVDPRLIDSAEIQLFLDNMGPGELFTVIFLRNDGSQAQYKGSLIPSDSRKQQVPIQLEDGGIKSFNINRVIYIERE